MALNIKYGADAFGNELQVGQFVTYAVKSAGITGCELRQGYVTGFTPKGVRIGHSPTCTPAGSSIVLIRRVYAL